MRRGEERRGEEKSRVERGEEKSRVERGDKRKLDKMRKK